MAVFAVVREGGNEPELLRIPTFCAVDHALVCVYQRGELREQHASHGREIALALEHAGEAGEVRLEPVLLGVAVGGEPQVVDHRVDIVLQLGHLSTGIDLDGSRQIALGHRGRDLGDRPHLRREVRGEQVHVSREVLPGTGGTGYVGLAAEPAFHADFACHRGDLVGEGCQRTRHVVDRLCQRGHLALRIHRQLGLQVAVCHRRHHLHDAAHLLREIDGHDVHVVGEVLPSAGHARNLGLPAEFSLRAHLARDARDFRREGVQLVDHRVDGRFELENLALDVHRNLPGQVAARHGRGDLRDVAHLRRQVRRKQVHVVGEVLPRARHSRNHRLTAKFSVGSHFTRHPDHFRGE